MEILPVIMDQSFNRLTVIDDYISLIWTARYYEPGDFELVLAADSRYAAYIKADYYITRDDDDDVGIIESIHIQRSEEGADTLIVSGRFLSSILERRIIATQTTVSGKISDCIDQLITDNVIAPVIADRTIPNFLLGSYTTTATMEAQYTGKNLLETVEAICETYGLGFRITLDNSHNFVFRLYAGEDRTYDQNVNPWVVFSDEYDNLLSSDYEENYRLLTTAVLVAGEGEGLDRRTVWVTTGETGLDRREAYKDQRQLRSNGGEIDDNEYDAMLAEAGEEDITRYVAAFQGTVYFESVHYKTDIAMGDLCVIENAAWGIYINTRLVEVIESISETGEYSIIPTFGK